MQQRFFAGSGGQADVDKREGVIYVKSGYCDGERAMAGAARAARVAGSVSIPAGQ